MSPSEQREEAVFEAALQLSPDQRTAYLEQVCVGDGALLRRVEVLLGAFERAGGFMKQPVMAERTARFSLPPTEKPGDKIGRYKLLEQIGEGGCGVVYVAEQEEPVRRRVALKVIKLGMDTKQVIARFDAERQALAMMEHPNIAKVFDAGATSTGRPYFVMELVRGIPITDYCDQNDVSPNERLNLFILVCRAIQHAHQKGIIHRDIKPSNILVTLHDGVPIPKVIDFGIAKAAQGRLTDQTVYTAFAQFVGTPAYMSPEQAEMSGLDVDTRSDIYSLGVLLYELLTGKTPFDAKELLAAGLDEMRRTIRETEPVKPSTRLTQELVAADVRRLHSKPENQMPKPEAKGASLRRLLQEVRGDLDWIVMKCLEKDRARRYETANGLAEDILHHLHNEPVTARSPKKLYLLKKLAQRNRGALAAVAIILIALLGALLTLATSNARIRRERNLKDQALREKGKALDESREQLFVSLQNQAQARRNSHQIGQRLESLAALAEAARIRPSAELRDNAIAALAMPDVERGPVWQAWDANTKNVTYDNLNQRYARMDRDGTLSIRTVPDNRELQRLECTPLTAPGGTGTYFEFSADGRFIAWVNEKGEARVWKWEHGESILRNPPPNCYALAFSPDSRRVAIGNDAWISCFDLATGEESRRWQTLGRAYQIEFHPDNRTLAVGYQESNVVSIYDADLGAPVTELPIGESTGTVVAWHPNGNLLATGGSDPRIQIWDVKSQRKVAVLEGHAQQINFLKFHWSGEMLASMSWDGDLRLWQPTPGRLLMRLPAGWMSISREGDRWAGFISPSNQQAQLWGIVPSREYHTFLNTFRDDENEFCEGDINSDGTLLALGTLDGVRLWDIARGTEVAWLRVGYTKSLVFLSGGRELLTCVESSGLQRWRIEAKANVGLQIGPPHSIALPFAPTRIAKSRDERTLAVVAEGANQCLLVDLVAESVGTTPMPHAKAAYIAMSPDTERVASSGWHSDRVKLWDGKNGKLIKEVEGRLSKVFFTPDNRELIVAHDKEFTFHDRNTLEVTRRLKREVGIFPGHVAFSMDGKMMALEMAPGVIHLKETASGQTVAKLEDPQGDHSTWMGFTPDGTQLIVAARYAGAIHRWDLRAIRKRLKTMNLDWDWPEYPSEAQANEASPKGKPPMFIQVLSADKP